MTINHTLVSEPTWKCSDVSKLTAALGNGPKSASNLTVSVLAHETEGLQRAARCEKPVATVACIHAMPPPGYSSRHKHEGEKIGAGSARGHSRGEGEGEGEGEGGVLEGGGSQEGLEQPEAGYESGEKKGVELQGSSGLVVLLLVLSATVNLVLIISLVTACSNTRQSYGPSAEMSGFGNSNSKKPMTPLQSVMAATGLGSSHSNQGHVYNRLEFDGDLSSGSSDEEGGGFQARARSSQSQHQSKGKGNGGGGGGKGGQKGESPADRANPFYGRTSGRV